jgi:hypothetical protein
MGGCFEGGMGDSCEGFIYEGLMWRVLCTLRGVVVNGRVQCSQLGVALKG